MSNAIWTKAILDQGNRVPVFYVDTVDLVHAVGSVHIIQTFP